MDAIRSNWPHTVILKYLDDTVIIGLIGSSDDTVNYQRELDRVGELCKSNHLLLNPAKTKEMVFCTKRDPLQVDPVLIEQSEQKS